jgi:hypothetical protein
VISAGLLALLLIGINSPFLSALLLGRRRKRDTAFPDSGAGGAVAVLIAAHDREDRIAQAVSAAAAMVPPANVHVVSDDSTDRTAEVARECGARVAETMGRLGRAGAFDAAIQAFRLVDEFDFVVLLDADTVPAPDYLDRALPLFDDPAVVAVDGRVDLDGHWAGRSAIGKVLAAYQARAYAVAEWLRARRTGSPVHVVPGAGRIYRSAVLRQVEINPPGAVVEYFDTTLQIHLERLGRIAFCPTARVSPSVPARLADYRAQHRQWTTGFWRAMGGHGLGRDAAKVVQLVLASVLLVLAPVALVASAVPGLFPVGPLTIALGVLVPDYLITLVFVVARRQPRYLLPGLLFPALRVLDAVHVLRARRGRAAAGEWLRFDEPVPRTSTRWIGTLLARVLLVAAAAAVVVRVVRTMTTLRASPIEPSLVDAAYGKITGLGVPPVDVALTATRLQLDAYASATGAFERRASTLTSAREVSVVAVVAVVIGLVLIAVLLRVRPLVMALPVAALAASGPVVTLLTPIGPGVVAAAWTTVAAAAALATMARHDGHWVAVGGIALLAAIATAPVLVVPIGVGAVAWFARFEGARWWTIGGTLAMTTGLAFLFWLGDLLPAPPATNGLVLTVVGTAALGALVVVWLRPVAAGVGAGVLLAAFGAPGAEALLPALVVATAVLVAVVLDEAVDWAGQRMPARWWAASLAAVASVAGAAAGVWSVPVTSEPVDHSGLAAWAKENLDGEARFAAPAGLWSDLSRDRTRDGSRESVVRSEVGTLDPNDLVVAVGSTKRPGVALARFGEATVLLQRTDSAYLSSAGRARAGTQLAENVRLRASDQVREALRAGQVDLRAMTVLAELCREHDIAVDATGKPDHERGSPLPDRVLHLSTVDGKSLAEPAAATALLDWLSVQQPPYAPNDTDLGPDGVALGWRLPPLHDVSPK